MNFRTHLPTFPRATASLLLAATGLLPSLPAASLPATSANAPLPQIQSPGRPAQTTLTGRYEGTAREQVDGVGQVSYPVQWTFRGEQSDLQLQVTGTAKLKLADGRELTAEVSADYRGSQSGGRLRMRSTRVELRIVEQNQVVQGEAQTLEATLENGVLSGRTGSEADGWATFQVRPATATPATPTRTEPLRNSSPQGADDLNTLVLQPLAIRDPGMGGVESHQLLVPEGWTFNGGAQWVSNLNTLVYFAGTMRSPAGDELHFGRPITASFGALNGQPSVPSSRRGVDQPNGDIVRPAPQALGEIAAEVLLPRLRPQATDVQLISAERMPEFEQQLLALIGDSFRMMQKMAAESDQQARMMGQQGQSNVFLVSERARLRYRENGRWWEEEIRSTQLGQTSQTNMSGMHMVQAGYQIFGVRSCRAPAERLQHSLPILLTLGSSLREAPRWSLAVSKLRTQLAAAKARGRAIALRQAQQIAQQSAGESVSDIQMRGWRERQASMDRIQKAEIDTIHETHDFQGSDGRTWVLPNTWDNAWMNAGGGIVVTNDPSYRPGADPNQNGVNWEPMQRIDPFRR